MGGLLTSVRNAEHREQERDGHDAYDHIERPAPALCVGL
jgi:hypothetical protein